LEKNNRFYLFDKIFFDNLAKTDNLVPSPALLEAQNIGAGDFRKVGDNMIAGLISRGYFNSDSRILDVGCGLGRLARPLTKYLAGRGEYYGLDNAKDSIEWCKSRYSSFDRFKFEWANVYSKFYNPEGRIKGSEYRFPYGDAFFDFVMLTSVFTHLLRPDIENYLAEIAGVIRPGGYCYSTWFLLTDELNREFCRRLELVQQPPKCVLLLPYFVLIKQIKSIYSVAVQFFRGYRTASYVANSTYALAPIDGGFVADKDIPEKVVCFRQDLVAEMHSRHGLEIDKINYGTWCGREVVGGYQDEVIALRRN
jgi:SAM-dependent methyltransferase